MLNDFEERHHEYRHRLQTIIDQLKNNDTNIQSELLELEWSVRNDLYRLETIGKDAFEDEYDELVKFVPVFDAIKKNYNIIYTIEESSFDDFDDEEEEETEGDDSLELEGFEEINFESEEIELDDFEGEIIEGEFLDLFPEFDNEDLFPEEK